MQSSIRINDNNIITILNSIGFHWLTVVNGNNLIQNIDN
jgi:hypothetical protein